MKKSTDELLKQLKTKTNIEEFFKENGSELIFDSLSEMIDFFMKRKGLKKIFCVYSYFGLASTAGFLFR